MIIINNGVANNGRVCYIFQASKITWIQWRQSYLWLPVNFLNHAILMNKKFEIFGLYRSFVIFSTHCFQGFFYFRISAHQSTTKGFLKFLWSIELNTAKSTVNSTNFLMWKYCWKVQLPHQEIRWNFGILSSEICSIYLWSET